MHFWPSLHLSSSIFYSFWSVRRPDFVTCSFPFRPLPFSRLLMCILFASGEIDKRLMQKRSSIEHEYVFCVWNFHRHPPCMWKVKLSIVWKILCVTWMSPSTLWLDWILFYFILFPFSFISFFHLLVTLSPFLSLSASQFGRSLKEEDERREKEERKYVHFILPRMK